MRGYHRHYQWSPRSSGYPRGRMARRIFIGFSFAIFSTAILASLIGRAVVSATEPQWEREAFRSLIASQFQRAWDNPIQRGQLAQSLTSSASIGVILRDEGGKTLGTYGEACNRQTDSVRVLGNGRELGRVEICGPSSWLGAVWRWLGVFVVAVLLLWGISAAVARRLARPLARLVYVTESIGKGDLSSRAPVSWNGHWEVAVLGKSINRMADRIQRQITDQRHLLAAVSHEIRAPLARIRVLTELAKTEGARAKTMDELDREVTGIDELVGNLLANSRLDFSAVAIRTLDANNVAREALQRAELPVDQFAPAPSTEFEGDPTLIARALGNLLDNAKRHGRGLDRMRVVGSDETIAFEVLDHGPGFAAGDEERVFIPFYQREGHSEASDDSLGIGLSIVKRVAEAHGGKVSLKNREGGGALVRFEIPRNHVDTVKGDP